MAYRIVAIPMILSDFSRHSPTTSPFKWDFLYSCAAVGKNSRICQQEAQLSHWDRSTRYVNCMINCNRWMTWRSLKVVGNSANPKAVHHLVLVVTFIVI